MPTQETGGQPNPETVEAALREGQAVKLRWEISRTNPKEKVLRLSGGNYLVVFKSGNKQDKYAMGISLAEFSDARTLPAACADATVVFPTLLRKMADEIERSE